MYISFDIDGVLVDASRRLSICADGERVNWDCFLDCGKLRLDRPKAHNLALMRRLAGRASVIVVTGRPEHMRKCTEEQLRRYGAVFERLFMRLEGDKRPDPLYKAEAFTRLSALGIVVAVHFEDNEDTAKALRSLGVDVVLSS